jgi:hypothetical protein
VNTEPLSDAFVAAIVAASAGRLPTPGLDGVVSLSVGKTTRAVFRISAGRAIGPSEATPEVDIPLTKKQLQAWADGTLSLSVAYMKGDVKPVGASGPLLAALELLDADEVRSGI